MPANLTPGYQAAEKRFKEAQSDEERLACLQEMLSTIPKHKGTERLQGDIKKRISKLRGRLEHDRKSGKRGFSHKVPREGSGQVALLGGPNTGKSQLLAALTNAEPDIAPYPFTTQRPIPGMMPFENVQIQMVDLPPFSEEHTEIWLPEVVRAADAALLVVDLSPEGHPLRDIEVVETCLNKRRVELKATDRTGKAVQGKQLPTLLVANRLDLPGSRESFDALGELYSDRFPILAVSAVTGDGLELLRRSVFELLRVIRVHSKSPGKEPDLTNPFTIPVGSTLMDFAEKVHKDFAESLKFARLWGPSAKFDGQSAPRDHVLRDGDIVELHL